MSQCNFTYFYFLVATSSVCPVYKIGKLRLDELVVICISKNIDNNLLARTVPWNIFKSAVYVIDTSVVDNKDLSTDGIIYDEHSSPSENIFVTLMRIMLLQKLIETQTEVRMRKQTR